MDRLMSLRIFREVVEAGSFTAAAERLNLSSPMASKHVAQLERQLGARLMHRSSRKLSLTEAGELYYAQCCQALDTLDAAAAALGQSALAPRGQLKVSAPVWCANRHFAQALADYRKQFPEVVVDMRLENRRVDLVADGFDLALRATHEPSPALIARPLCPVQFILVATPKYLKQVGAPANPADIVRLDAIVPSYVNLDGLYMLGAGGKAPVRLTPTLRSDDTTLAHHCVMIGLGIAFLPEWLVADDLASSRLVRVLPSHVVPETMLHAVYTSRRYATPKLRSFIDFFSQRLGGPQQEPIIKSPAVRPEPAQASSLPLRASPNQPGRRR